MRTSLHRRDFLRHAGLGFGSAATLALFLRHAFAVSPAVASPPPVVDQLKVRVVLDTTHDPFIGGFHLAPAPKDYVAQAVAELKTPDVVVPMHCSGANFIDAMRQQMPEKLVLSSVGSRFTFGA
jgi:hypothetical protein